MKVSHCEWSWSWCESHAGQCKCCWHWNDKTHGLAEGRGGCRPGGPWGLKTKSCSSPTSLLDVFMLSTHDDDGRVTVSWSPKQSKEYTIADEKVKSICSQSDKRYWLCNAGYIILRSVYRIRPYKPKDHTHSSGLLFEADYTWEKPCRHNQGNINRFIHTTIRRTMVSLHYCFLRN